MLAESRRGETSPRGWVKPSSDPLTKAKPADKRSRGVGFEVELLRAF